MAKPDNESPFCELIRLAVDHAPTPDAREHMQELYTKHCTGVTAQEETGDNGPPPGH